MRTKLKSWSISSIFCFTTFGSDISFSTIILLLQLHLDIFIVIVIISEKNTRVNHLIVLNHATSYSFQDFQMPSEKKDIPYAEQIFLYAKMFFFNQNSKIAKINFANICNMLTNANLPTFGANAKVSRSV